MTLPAVLRGHTRSSRLLLALAGVVAAMGVRAAMQPWLGDSAPFGLAFAVVVLVHARAGWRAALLSALGCAAWALAPAGLLGLAWLPRASPTHALLFVATSMVFAALLDRVLDPVRQDALGEPRAGLLWWLRVGIALSLVLPAALFGSIALYTHGQALAEARLRVDRAARIAAEHASRVIETNTVIAQRLMLDLDGLDDEVLQRREVELHRALAAAVAGIPQIQSVSVWGSDGRARLSSRLLPAPRTLSVAQRDDFAWCRDGRGDWVVSQPALSRLSGEAFFTTTRCRRAADGRFEGVVAVALRPEFFQAFYASLGQSEPGLVLALVRDDGAVLVQQQDGTADGAAALTPAGVAAIRSGVASAALEPRSAAAPEMLSVALRRLEPFPMVVRAAMGRNAALVRWQQQVGVLAAVVFPAALALAAVTAVALRRARRELEAVRRLRAETEQRSRAEQALQQSQKLEALGQLTGGVAHDFNNLLMVVSNNAQLLRRQHPALAEAKALAGIQRAVRSGAKLTRQLLAFSRRQALTPEVVDLRVRLAELADFLRTSLGSGVTLRVDVAPDTLPVRIDAAEFELALLNLAINARDAMLQGGRLDIRVHNGASTDAAPAPQVLIHVQDSGSGIAPELLGRVFEPFFTTKPPGSGTGLGLSQVYGFCAQAGGRAEIASTPGQGTEVTLHLPAQPAQPEAGVAAAAPGAAGAPRRVLLVEDNEEIAESAAALIRSFGHAVRHVATADAAAALWEHGGDPCDVLVTDVMMPGRLNGIALALQVRVMAPQVGIVVMTGYTAELQRAREAGLAVLAKPVEAAVLQEAIRSARGVAAAPTPIDNQETG